MLGEDQQIVNKVIFNSPEFFSQIFSTISEDSWFFFPTSLYATKVRSELIKAGIPHNPDRFTPLFEFCRKFHASHAEKTRIITEGQAMVLLVETLKEIQEDVPFFFNQGTPSAGVLRDFLDLKNILSQRKINFFSHPVIQSSEKCRQISHALGAYQEKLLKRGALDFSSLIEWTINEISGKKEYLFGSAKFYGLYNLYPREQGLVCTIRDHAKKFQYFFPSGDDPSIFSSPQWLNKEDIFPLEFPHGRSKITGIFSYPIEKTDHIYANVFATLKEEIEAIAQEIHSIYAGGTPLEEIVITTPDLSSDLALIRDVFSDFGIPYYSHVGEPLIREPVISTLISIISLVIDKFPRKDVVRLFGSPYFHLHQEGLPDISVADFDLITRSAGIEGGDSWDGPLQALKEQSKEKGPCSLHIPDELFDSVQTWISEIRQDFYQLKEDTSLTGYCAIMQRLITRWINPQFIIGPSEDGDVLLNRERRAFQLFRGCLKRLSSLDTVTPVMSIANFRKYLKFILEEPVNLSDDSGGVMVMGLHQSLMMGFPYLFIGGLIEGDLPHPSTRLPLLNSKESVLLGSRSLAEIIAEDKYYFVSALAIGGKIYLSAPRTSNERVLLTSSFFERIKKVLNPPGWGGEITRSKNYSSIKAGRIIAGKEKTTGNAIDQRYHDPLALLPSDQTYGSVAERVLIEDWYRSGSQNSIYDGVLTEDEGIRNWLSGPARFGPGRIWSPTQLETYAQCPYRFFLERVVHLKPLPDVDLTVSPASKGSLVHETLCDFYKQWCFFGPRKITSNDLKDASTLLKKIGRQKSEKYHYQSPVWHATVATLLGSDDIPGLYDRFLIHETDKEDSQFRPDTFELTIGTSDNKPADKEDPAPFIILYRNGAEPIKIQGHIDRVDTSPDGFFTIIDYKTGSSYPNSNDIRDGRALQLPLYLLAFEKMHERDDRPLIGIGGAYYEISRKVKQTWPLLDPGRKNMIGVPRIRSTPDFRDVLSGSLDSALAYIRAIRDGIFPVAEEKCTASSYCEYSGICRFDRFRISIDEDPSGGEE